MSETQRNFTTLQRRTIFLASGGKCAMCGVEITETDFHADHVFPFSKGGPTETSNGQALCAPCNLEKGSTIMSTPTIETPDPVNGVANREWQKNCLTAIEKALTAKENCFLANVTPSGGKTRMALEQARRMVRDCKANFVVVISPTDNTRGNISAQSKLFGFIPVESLDENHLKATKDSNILFSTTYAWLTASNIAKLTGVMAGKKVLLIVDEVHHAAESQTWGDAVLELSKASVFRLALSGTPYRSDDLMIPFLSYKNNRGKPHFEYSYEDALRDKVVAPVFFRWVSGDITVEMPDPDTGATTNRQFSFDASSAMPEDELRVMLGAATNFPNGFAQALLAAADDELTAQRKLDIKGEPRSGGLVIAKSIQDAQRVFNFITNILKKKAVLITSDDSVGARQSLENFKTETGPEAKAEWLVSVGMVSEGTDIPRLRVLAYLTNKVTLLSFTQAVGRVTRLIENKADASKTRPSEAQPVFVFLPNFFPYLQFSQDAQRAVQHVLNTNTNEEAETVARDAQDEAVEAAGGQRAAATATVTCPSCGHETAAGDDHCHSCGNPMPARTVRHDRVIVDADGYVDGASAGGGRRFTEEQMEAAVAAFRKSAQDHLEYDTQTHVPWAVRSLTKFLLGCAFLGDEDQDAILAKLVAVHCATKTASGENDNPPEGNADAA